MTDLTSKTVEELRVYLLDGYDEEIWGVATNYRAFDELVSRLEEAQQRSEAHDAEVAAKALEEFANDLRQPWLSRAAISTVLQRLYQRATEYRAEAGRKE